MIYLISFLVFLFFVGAMSLGLILRKQPLKTEDEATAAILGELSCASCTAVGCSFAGARKNHAGEESCAAGRDAAKRSIPHKVV